MLQNTHSSPQDLELAVRFIVEALLSALSQGERIEIRGFGSFSLNHRLQRQGRNPRTGEIVLVPAKRLPQFKAGKDLRERVNVKALAATPAEPRELSSD